MMDARRQARITLRACAPKNELVSLSAVRASGSARFGRPIAMHRRNIACVSRILSKSGMPLSRPQKRSMARAADTSSAPQLERAHELAARMKELRVKLVVASIGKRRGRLEFRISEPD